MRYVFIFFKKVGVLTIDIQEKTNTSAHKPGAANRLLGTSKGPKSLENEKKITNPRHEPTEKAHKPE